jgi:phage tail-like protein
MAQFTVNNNPQRFDLYKNFKFRINWDNRCVAGFSRMGPLNRSTEVANHRDGGDPSSSRKSTGRTEYGAITLERGVTHDPEFQLWANKVWCLNAALDAEVSLTDFRKNIDIDVYDAADQRATTYTVFRCCVSELQSLSEFDANTKSVVIQTMKLEHDGWMCDIAVTNPTDPEAT